MSCFDQSHFDIRCEWGLNGIQQLAKSDVIIIVDILSFTTSVDIALGRGITILPYPLKDQSAVQYAKQHNAELASTTRNGPPGTYSLAPSSLASAPTGLRLVLPSPNGSNLAFTAISSGAVVIAGCLRNASAVAAHARQSGPRISVIPAGERWPDATLRPAIEDQVGAGAILKQLPGNKSPEAQLAIAAFDNFSQNLSQNLLACSSGRELTERGYIRDVQLAAELNISTTVPVLHASKFINAHRPPVASTP